MRCTRLVLLSGLFLVGWWAIEARGELIDVQLRAVASPTVGDTIADPPTSLVDVPLGNTFYLETWIKDVGSPLYGVSGGYLDIAYDTAKFDAMAISHGSLYTTFTTGTVNDTTGLIDELGGSYLGEPFPGKTSWALLGRVTFQRTASGMATFTPEQSDDEFSRGSGGAAAWNQIDAPSLALGVPEPGSLVLLTAALLALGSVSLLKRRRHCCKNAAL